VFANREQALAWLDAEHANLIAICVTASDHHLPQISTDLAFALAKFLSFRRYFDDSITINTLAVEIFRKLGDRHGEGMVLNNLRTALREVRRFDAAIGAHTEAAEIFRQLGDRHRDAAARANLGIALAALGRSDEARESWEQAIRGFADVGETTSAELVRQWVESLPPAVEDR
jgi:tetratricopeptide (TPR) repeat protein